MTQMERLITAVKENPEGVLLLGAAVALILRKATAANRKSEPKQRRTKSVTDVAQPSSPIHDYVADARDSALEYVDAAKSQARRTLRKSKTSAKRLAKDQPLGLAVGGLAAGIMLAAIFPATELEQKSLGPLGRRASDLADDAKEQVKDVAQAVGAGIKDAAREGFAEVAQQFRTNAGSNNGQA
jgi:hypothetical protein